MAVRLKLQTFDCLSPAVMFQVALFAVSGETTMPVIELTLTPAGTVRVVRHPRHVLDQIAQLIELDVAHHQRHGEADDGGRQPFGDQQPGAAQEDGEERARGVPQTHHDEERDQELGQIESGHEPLLELERWIVTDRTWAASSLRPARS